MTVIGGLARVERLLVRFGVFLVRVGELLVRVCYIGKGMIW